MPQSSHGNLQPISGQIDLPAVFKPQFAGGGHRGVSVCKSENEFPVAFKKAVMNSFNQSAVIESFCAGKEYKACGFIQGGEVKMCVTAQRSFGSNRLPGLPISLSIGPSENKHVNELAILFSHHIQTVCQHIGLRDAPLNIDIILSAGMPEIIDFDIVLGSFAHLVNKATGIDMFDAYANLCLGNELDLNHKYFHGAACTYLWFAAVEVSKDLIEEACRGAGNNQVFESRLWDTDKINANDPVCAGHLITEGKTQEEALLIGKNWLNTVQTEVNRLSQNQFQVIMPRKLFQ